MGDRSGRRRCGPRDDPISTGLGSGSTLVEPLGAESLVHGVLPSGEELTVRMTGASPLSGAVLPIGLPPLLVHVFDAATGQRADGVSMLRRPDAAASVANAGADR